MTAKEINFTYVTKELETRDGQDIAHELGMHPDTLSRILVAAGYPNLRYFRDLREKPKFNHGFFESIDCEEKAYWLGFIMADGCVIRTKNGTKNHHIMSIELNEKDAAHLQKFADLIGYEYPLSKQVAHNAIKISCRSIKMCDDLAKYGCVERKSLTLKFPQNIEGLYIRHMIRGFFDGDGCAHVHRGTYRGQASMSMVGTLDFLLNIQKHLGCNQKLQKHVSDNLYVWSQNGNKAIVPIFEYLYDGATVFLERKYNIIKNQLDKCDKFIEIGFYQKKMKSPTTGYKGVCRHKGRFVATVTHHKKRLYVGYYDTAIEAALAYDNKAKELFGDLAFLNFPNKRAA